MQFFLGTAGWAVPKQHLPLFSAFAGGAKQSHLGRYASRFSCVEINSSFHRPHRRATWERWAGATPDDFRFAVKAPKAVTHTAKLVGSGGALRDYLGGYPRTATRPARACGQREQQPPCAHDRTNHTQQRFLTFG